MRQIRHRKGHSHTTGSRKKICPGRSALPATSVFPVEYSQALRQAQDAVKASILDGHIVLEVEFPVGSLWGVQGAVIKKGIEWLTDSCPMQVGGVQNYVAIILKCFVAM